MKIIKFLSDFWFKLRACCRLLISKRSVHMIQDKEHTYSYFSGEFNFEQLYFILLNTIMTVIKNLDKEDRDYLLKYIERGDLLKDVTTQIVTRGIRD